MTPKRRSKPILSKKRQPRAWMRLIALLLLTAVLLLVILRKGDRRPPALRPDEVDSSGVKVIDGDTFIRADGEKVRLLGIDSPERGEPYSARARKHLRGLIANQKLHYSYGPELTDTYGRSLAFVYAGTTFVNGSLVRAGLARAYIFTDYFLLTQPGQAICAAQQEALAARRGIWSLSAASLEARYFGNSNTRRFHRPDCRSIRNSDTLALVRQPTREDFLLQCYSPCRNCDP